jgi:large subunit ribosomal protein L10
MPTLKKSAEIDLLVDRLERAQMTIVADYRGLTVAQMQDFRSRVKDSDSEFRVTKNTLLRIAAERVGIDGLDEHLEGPTAVLFAFGDVVAPAKAVADFARTSRILTVKSGVMNNQVLSAAEVDAISSLPPREELIGKLVGMLASPMARVVGVLNGPARSVAYLANARIEQLSGSGEAEAEAAD